MPLGAGRQVLLAVGLALHFVKNFREVLVRLRRSSRGTSRVGLPLGASVAAKHSVPASRRLVREVARCVAEGAALGALAALYVYGAASGPVPGLTVTAVPVMETSSIDPLLAITS